MFNENLLFNLFTVFYCRADKTYVFVSFIVLLEVVITNGLKHFCVKTGV